jgi:hypothetical protein
MYGFVERGALHRPAADGPHEGFDFLRGGVLAGVGPGLA